MRAGPCSSEDGKASLGGVLCSMVDIAPAYHFAPIMSRAGTSELSVLPDSATNRPPGEFGTDSVGRLASPSPNALSNPAEMHGESGGEGGVWVDTGYPLGPKHSEADPL